jgi:anti-sigma-K factor RskA
MNLSRPDRSARLDALAASYALGTLAGRSRRRLDRIAQTDPAVAAAVRGWEWRLAALTEGMPGITPPLHVWEGIRKRLGLSGDADSTRSAAAPWWSSLSLWRGLALAGFALAFALGALLLAPTAERPFESVVVVLAGPDATPALVATAERGSRYLTVKAVGAEVPPGRALELWMLPDGRPPVSMGLVPASGIERLLLREPAGVALQNIPALAVSVEPPGGSPTGAPTGPVVYTGRVERIY